MIIAAAVLQARVKRRLDMPNLGLETFPMEIEYMTYLTALDMSSNRIRELDTKLTALVSLRLLSMHDNQVSD